MNFLKQKWKLLTFAVVCAGSIGMGGWAYVAGSEVESKLTEIQKLTQVVDRLSQNPANETTIEAKKEEIERKKQAFEETFEAALAMQQYNPFYEQVSPDGSVERVKRQTIIPDVLPEPRRDADALEFREAYVREFSKLAERLRARGPAGPEEVQNETRMMEALRGEDDAVRSTPWPVANIEPKVTEAQSGDDEESIEALVRKSAAARASEVVAKDIWMYLDENAIAKHPLAETRGTPSAEEIWQAQLGLWIQQDMVTALARMNERRARNYSDAGELDKLWVAYMPVKRLEKMAIAPYLGNGGELNNADWKESFTGIENNKSRFMVPVYLKMVVEEAAVMDVINSLCSVGYYTPIWTQLQAVTPDPTYKSYIYGDEPVVELEIIVEGYYFRSVFEEWIPKDLKKVMEMKGAMDESAGRGRRGR